MSMAALRWARGVRDLEPGAKLVLLLLADHADDRGECWPSVAGLAADGCMGERTVQRALGALVAAGIVTREGNGGRGLTRRYTLRLDHVAAERVSPEAERVPSTTAERVPSAPERVSPATERVPVTTERVSPWHPNPQEPSRTPIEPPQPRPLALPDWLPLDAWADWCRHKGRKWGTGQGPPRAIKALERYRDEGHDPRDVIDHSLAGGYQGLYPPKGQAKRSLDWTDTDPLFGGRA